MTVPSKMAEYNIRACIIQRCENSRHTAYHNYGGRGIRICERWRKSFNVFLADVGPRPSPVHTLDRLDNDGDYEPGNVKWATADEQAKNRNRSGVQRQPAPLRPLRVVSYDLTGAVFARLTVLSKTARKGRDRAWRCQCACGAYVVVTSASLRSGNTKSCGCLKRERIARLRLKHGEAGSKLYWVWADLVGRCTNPSHARFADYGGRGITVCARWRASFADFHSDVGARPLGYTLDRKDNNGGYEPGNVQWSTRLAQANNKRNNARITYQGRTQTLAEWARETGLPYDTLKGRLRNGWQPEKALTREVGRWL